ncbi:LysR family transcriptional regulator [Mesorhizobium sp. AR02]|uniref:LysR family transcriptional regulator n=1 Tax=Mesorhizobium sp. AR02 TaxID=2865837 RepID=UPI00215FE187|nr:LysR family transcriptional regulator [Mesorhizobium sp. AR02]UVK51244.1 LysR family transcriptional regulator [Mesorhizobium sp. AR02]
MFLATCSISVSAPNGEIGSTTLNKNGHIAASIMKADLTMESSILAGLPVFRMVARAGGFTAASGRLGISVSAVSQSIRQIELRLGIRLFDRTSRNVRLTERGRQLLETIEGPIGLLAGAIETAREVDGEPSGHLRITLSRLAAEICILPTLVGFVRRYPAIRLELSTDDRLTDIVSGGFDAGIRFRGTLELDMISVPLGPPLRRSMLASKDYLARAGEPQTPEDLSRHAVIRYRFPGSGRLEPLTLRRGEETILLDPPAVLILDDNGHFALASRAGLGLAQRFRVTEEAAIESGELVSVLDAYEPELQQLHIYFPSRDLQPAKLRAFIDWFKTGRAGTDTTVGQDAP